MMSLRRSIVFLCYCRLVISLRGLRLCKAVRISVWKPVLDHASVPPTRRLTDPPAPPTPALVAGAQGGLTLGLERG